jgi:hypothetical protein
MLGSRWAHYGPILDPFWANSDSIQGPIWGHYGPHERPRCGLIFGPFLGRMCGPIFGPIWGPRFGPYWSHKHERHELHERRSARPTMPPEFINGRPPRAQRSSFCVGTRQRVVDPSLGPSWAHGGPKLGPIMGHGGPSLGLNLLHIAFDIHVRIWTIYIYIYV